MHTVDVGVGDGRTTETAAQARRRIAETIAGIDHVLPGTITVRLAPCGKPTCHCHADPPQLHGPYISWTRKVDGKTVTRLLSEEQWAEYQPWFENTKRFKQLAAELETLSLREIENDPRWLHK
jgi:hypothetical protein